MMSVISLWGMPIVEPDPEGGDQRATRSAVELATCVTRRSTVMAWLSSTAPMNMMAMIGTIRRELDGRDALAIVAVQRRSEPAEAGPETAGGEVTWLLSIGGVERRRACGGVS